jgi:deoxyadenosine/deoxycytidine kinase
MYASLPKPDLLVYLYADIVRLQKNIKKRGRYFEQNISDAYLQSIQERYLDYLRKQNDFPVIILDVTAVDFVSDKLIYEHIKESLLGVYDQGVYQKKL